MRPVLAGLCKYECLIDGSLGLEDIALMNDALDVREDNIAIANRRLKDGSI